MHTTECERTRLFHPTQSEHKMFRRKPSASVASAIDWVIKTVHDGNKYISSLVVKMKFFYIYWWFKYEFAFWILLPSISFVLFSICFIQINKIFLKRAIFLVHPNLKAYSSPDILWAKRVFPFKISYYGNLKILSKKHNRENHF